MYQVAEPGWKNAFTVMKTNYSLTDDAIGVFAINLRFNLDDIQTIASEAITGGGDDKKCDVLYVDKERQVAIIAQCYISKTSRPAAPANKAYCRIWTICRMRLRDGPTNFVLLSMRAKSNKSTSGTFIICRALQTSKTSFAQSKTRQGVR